MIYTPLMQGEETKMYISEFKMGQQKVVSFSLCV